MNKKHKMANLLLLSILFLFGVVFTSSAYDDYDSLIGSGEFTSAHTEECDCPGKNPPHIYLDILSGNCGCPSRPIISIRGCEAIISCDLEDDAKTILTINIPCPIVYDANPKYPLVKMLTGILAEWDVDKDRKMTPTTITYASNGTEVYGTEMFTGFDLDIIVSTVDTGKKWNQQQAEKIAKAKEIHSRTNIDVRLESPALYVKTMTAKDIYEAYKSKSDAVQAYLALENRNFGERPWTSYEKFIQEMCKKSVNSSLCERGLLGTNILGRVGNFWLGNGNPTVVGVYSEVSSHPCHGATVINDQGDPAFGIVFRSTFYVYFHASWANHYTYGNVEDASMGPACTSTYLLWHDNWVTECTESDDDGNCTKEEQVNYPYTTTQCGSWVEIHGCVDDFIPSGGGESSGDCPECLNLYGYQDEKGYMHTGSYPILFNQSQPILQRK